MKKAYTEPSVEKVSFDYKNQVVASEEECFAVQPYSYRKNGCTTTAIGNPVMNEQ